MTQITYAQFRENALTIFDTYNAQPDLAPLEYMLGALKYFKEHGHLQTNDLSEDAYNALGRAVWVLVDLMTLFGLSEHDTVEHQKAILADAHSKLDALIEEFGG